MLPPRELNQLSKYYDEQSYRYNELIYGPMTGTGRVHEVRGKADGLMWYGYPVNYTVANNYAGLSTAPNTDAERAADTTAGDVVADAGFGGL
jgi:hypothetical protein